MTKKTTKPASVVTVDHPDRGVRARFEVQPGLNLFVGRNGAGKSTAIMATLATAGVPEPGLTSMTPGRASGFGVVLELGRRVKLDGTPSVEVVDSGAFSRLAQPASDKRATRNEHRIKALFAFRTFEIDDQVLLDLCLGSEVVAAAVQQDEAWRDCDLLGLADAARRAANACALGKENEANEASGAAKALARRAESLPPSGKKPAASASTFASELANKISTLARLRFERQTREELERQKREVLDTLGDRPEPEGAELDLALAEDEVSGLEAKLAEARGRVSDAKRSVERLRVDAITWDQRRAVLDRPVTGATAGDVAAAELDAAELEAQVESARIFEEWQEISGQAQAARTKQSEADRLASFFREIARGVPQAMSDLLAANGIAGVSVVDGELATELDGELRKIEDMSLGQQVRWAYSIAMPAYESAAAPVLLHLPEKPFSPWHALDLEGKRGLVETCRDLGICLLVEQAIEGDLSVIHDVL